MRYPKEIAVLIATVKYAGRIVNRKPHSLFFIEFRILECRQPFDGIQAPWENPVLSTYKRFEIIRLARARKSLCVNSFGPRFEDQVLGSAASGIAPMFPPAPSRVRYYANSPGSILCGVERNAH